MSVLEELNLFRRRLTPVVLAAEAAECGLACMTMIARRYGHDVDLNGLRQRFSFSINGANLRSLMELADQLGFACRPIKIEPEALNKVQLPAVLHWNLNHFVVLTQARHDRVVIHDPALGRREIRLEEVSDHFTGVALELRPADDFKPMIARQRMRLANLWSKMTGFWPAFFQILALTVALQVVTFAAPFQMQLVVDEALARADRDLLAVLALGFGVLVIIQSAIFGLREYALQVLGHLMTFQMIGNLVRHLLRLQTSFFEKRHVGDILSRIQSTRPIQDAITKGVVTAIIDGAMAVIALVILFFYSGMLTIVVLASLILSVIVTFAFYPMVRRRSEEALLAGAKEQSHLIESVRAARTLKLMGREAERESAWRNLFADTINANFSVGKFAIAQQTLQQLITGLQTIIVVYLAGRIILAGDGFSVGMLFAFLSFRQTFTDRIIALINQAIQFRLLTLHLDRIGDIVQAEREVPAGEGLAEIEVQGGIEVSNISFRYGSGDRLVLENISLEIEPGDFVAITGPSGEGKTTLIKLLLGLYTPEQGQILLDGERATPALFRAWRRQVGVVAQDDQLLSGTIADNIALFDPELDMSRVEGAARQARIHDDIMRMPMRYLSLIGDMGSSLSGGQRQRVFLARAIYREPKVLILDEGTANLDPVTEAEIADLLCHMSITRIAVAHRPALIEKADKVLEIRNGNLI
jgi:ATP-binding cassette subfamily B protein RaxB